jgi:predicted DsbA family dithiol-disulfide isomerase
MRIDVWSDIACPWCYIGKRRLDAALAGFEHPIELTWHSYELDPNAPAASEGDHASLLASKYGRTRAQAEQMLDDMTATAAKDGLDYNFHIAKSANTFDAHRVLHLAAERGLQREMAERVFAANFTDGELLSDHETLIRLAVEVGLDRQETADVLANDSYALAVRADEEQARRLGIAGVPFFVFAGKYGVSGAQSAEVLRRVIDKSWNEQSEQELAPAE